MNRTAFGLVVALFSMAVLGACSPSSGRSQATAGPPEPRLVSEEQAPRLFEITNRVGPRSRTKNRSARPFRVSLRAVHGERTYSRERVARRCSSWRQVEIGSQVELIEITKTYDNGQVFHSLANIEQVCPSNRR